MVADQAEATPEEPERIPWQPDEGVVYPEREKSSFQGEAFLADKMDRVSELLLLLLF